MPIISTAYSKKRVLFFIIIFTVLIAVSLFFANYFSAFSLSEEKNTIPIPQPETQDYREYISVSQPSPVFQKEAENPKKISIDTEVEMYDAVQHPLIKKESPLASPPIIQKPTQEKEEDVPIQQVEPSHSILKEEVTKEIPEQDLIVVRIVDGDTLVLSDKKTVRLIGINTPEKDQPYYAEAKNRLGDLVMGKPVRLEKDISDTDKYGRLLRYVYIDDLFINLEMIRSGYANAYAYPPDTAHKEEFLSAEKIARTEGVGLWKKSTSPQPIILAELHADTQGSDAKNLNDEYVILKNTGNSPLSLSRWSMKDAGTHIYTFPDFTLTENTSVTIFSGKGANTQNSLYWNSKDPIWNNDSDTLYLRTASGELAIEYTYSTP